MARARGTTIPLSAAQIVARALSQLTAVPTPPADAPPDAGGRPIHYRLEYPNGGDDPTAAGCHLWAYGDRTPVADCVGLALWAAGIDRKQPGFRGPSGGWLDTPGVMHDARGDQRWFREVDLADSAPGDLLVDERHVGVLLATPRYRDHMRGTITRPALGWTKDGGRVDLPSRTWHLAALADKLGDVITVDCSTRHNEHGIGLGVGIGKRWSGTIAVRRVELAGPFDGAAFGAALIAAIAAAALVFRRRRTAIALP